MQELEPAGTSSFFPMTAKASTALRCFWLAYVDTITLILTNPNQPSQPRPREQANQRQSKVGHNFAILGKK